MEAFLTSTTLVAIAEIGDKTQFATITLGVQYQGALIAVVTGTTFGMMLANVPAVIIGDRLAARLPLKHIRWVAAAMFVITGVATILSAITNTAPTG